MMIDADNLIHTLGDRTRLRALVLMKAEGALCVCELTAALGVSQPKMSRHLAAMRAAGVVEDCRVGNRVFYRIAPNLPDWAGAVIDRLAEAVVGTSDFAAVRRRLHDFPNRPRKRVDFGGGRHEGEAPRRGICHAV